MDETKSGARHSAGDQKLIQEIHDKALELGAVLPESNAGEWETVKTDADTFVAYGDEIKALGDGRIAGYLVRFSSEDDPDLTGDYFTKDTDFGEVSKLPLLYHHGLDAKMGKRRIGTAQITADEVGLWLESQMNLRDEYEKAIYKMVEQRKQGLSSGAAAHAVTRTRGAKAAHITQWYIAEASVTPTPAEPRNGVVALKTLPQTEIELPEAEPEARERGDAADESPAATAAPSQEIVTAVETKTAPEEFEMDEQEKKTLLDEIKAVATEATKASLDEWQKQNAPAEKQGGKLHGAPAHLTTPRGDDAFKAFSWYLKTGDAGGIRTGEAYKTMLDQANTDPTIKTDYNLVEGTQYQGQEAVPTEVYNGIIERRDAISVMRAGGAMVVNANSNAMVIPVEKAAPQAFGIQTEAGSFTTLTQQPMDKLSATIYLFSYNLPFSIQLIDDATFDVQGWGSRYVGRGLGLTENTYMLMGTGSSQPQGAVYAGTSGVTAASATAVTAAEIVKLYYTLASEYRDRVLWVMAGATEAAVRQLTSTQMPFVGNGGDNGGVGQGGFPQGAGWLVAQNSRVFNSSAMDALTASKKPISCMNPEAGYAIVDRKGLTVLRDPYSAAGTGKVHIWFYSRFGGGVVNATAIQNLATPSA